MNPRHTHRFELGLAVAPRFAPDVKIEIVTVGTFTKWHFFTIRVTPRRRTAFPSKDIIKGIHYLLDLSCAPLECITFACFE